MPPNSDYIYAGLLSYNYFPMVKERRDDIPPLFSTESLTPDLGDKLIDHFNELSNNQQDKRERSGFDQIEYRTTRFNNILRLMHIPHPLPFARLCGCLRDNWGKLSYVCSNECSQIKPEEHADGRVYVVDEYESLDVGRVVVMEKDRFPDELERHLDYSHGASYFVDADVSGCFPSIYSHAIPWALVGHEYSKNNRSKDKWFNQLDILQRNMKRGETQGVPVGPATSNIMNEVILARVDEALAHNYKFVRYIDDYKCYCKTREQADAFIRDLERELSHYLLTLNARKISITPLPVPSKAPWVTELTRRLPHGKRLNERDVVDTLDTAVHLQRQHPEGSVVKYAARATSSRMSKRATPLFCNYLLQLAFHYPIVLPILCDVAKRRDVDLDDDALATVLDRQILYRRSDMMCWTIYLMALTETPIPENTAEAIVDAGDCMAIAALLARDEHVDKIIHFVKSIDHQQPYEMDKYWLLIHELALQWEWDIPVNMQNYLNRSGLQMLVDESVSFIRSLD